ncbi:heparinase II/III family protein [Dysgonomonas termitidis]|uniref:Heparinase II/III-family protein n=1 Tax=Dysgonomonas termitidis TaxID=1516126 RepID=A0ABV9KQC3_9BACT
MKRVLTICLLLICLSANAYKDRDLLQKAAGQEKLGSMLVTDQKWVRYPNYSDRDNWDQFFGENKTYLIEQGEKYLNYEWKVVKATDYLEYTRSGDRSIMERIYNGNLNAVSSLFIAEMAEGKGRFMDQLTNGIFQACEMTSWSISAHLALQRVRGSFPNLNDHVIDLVSGDVGATFSWIYYFLNKEFDKINPLISERLHYEIENRILTPYLNETRFWWMATNATSESAFVNNWNPWCNANVIQCFLLVEKDKDRLLKGVYKSMVSVDKFINYNHDDGACEEGPSYWGHAAGKMYDYLQILYDATNGGISIFSDPMIRNMGEYIARSYIGNGWVVNFADASAKSSLDYRLIYRYGNMVKSTEMEQFASYLKKEKPEKISTSRDTYRLLADLSSDKEIDKFSPVHIATPFTWYPDTEFCYMSEGKLFFAAKGGYNDESHNHNDTGTFSLYAGNEPVFIDVGVGTYTRQTFSSERYTIWTMQSDYHNIPRINGFSQNFGKKYKAKDLKADKNNKTFVLDVSQSYPAEAGINKWIRSYKLSKNSLVIEDNYDIMNARTANQLNFMTSGKVDASQPGIVKITIKNKTYQLIYDKNIFDPVSENIKLDDIRLSGVWGDEIVRISLNAKKINNRGIYKIFIKA